MNCRECEEIVATAARGRGSSALPDAASAHLAACASYRGFGAAMDATTAALDRWEMPGRGERAAAERAALIARLASGAPAPDENRFLTTLGRTLRQPALIGVMGAAAAGAGAWASPGWAQQAIAGWAGGAAVLASLVLLCHGRPAILRGEYR